MADDQKTVEAPKVEVAQAPPMTDALFLERAGALIEEGDAAGLNTTQLLFRLGVRRGAIRGVNWVEQGLALIQSGNAQTVKK